MGESKKMFCPKCGREQSVDGQRFCSGCGMSLDAVIEMMPPTNDGLAEKGWTRKDGMKLSVFIFVAGTLGLTPLAAVLDLDELTPIFAVLGFGGAVTVMTYSLLFLPKRLKALLERRVSPLDGSTRGLKGIAVKVSDSVKQKIGGRIHDTADQNETRPVGYIPPIGDWRDIEYPQPPSVTDSTTKLLAEEEQKKRNQ